jgi:methylmalonyl-CoA mutase N-terminal domain/subunit
MDPQGYERQVARLENLRLDRDNAQVETALNALRAACANDDNTMPCLIEAAKASATLSEITDVMREVFGVYREPALI